jgi:hypothetical protein
MNICITSLLVLAAAIPLSACVESPDAPPQASASVVPPPVRAPMSGRALPPVTAAPPAPALTDNWIDWPISQGDWRYSKDAAGTMALFGASGGETQFAIRCDRTRGQILLSRAGAFPAGETGRMTLRATSGLQTYGVANSADGAPFVVAALPVRDPQLDAIIYSRGRFLVSVKGGKDIAVPNWSEFARVVEDCR